VNESSRDPAGDAIPVFRIWYDIFNCSWVDTQWQ